MRRLTLSIVLCAVAFDAGAAAGKLSCYEEPATRKRSCIDANAVTVNGDTRAALVYSGGPNGVRATSVTFVTNCAKGITTLQDRDGVNFAGALSSATEASESLSHWMCAVKNPKKNAKLRQF
jgi:hypothetical protein